MFPDLEESFLSSVIAAMTPDCILAMAVVVLFGSHSVAHGSLGLLFLQVMRGFGGGPL